MKQGKIFALLFVLIVLFARSAALFGWEALPFEESRKRTLNKLTEISTKYATDDAELAKKAAAVVAEDAKAKKNTDWLEKTLDFVGYSLERYPAQKGTDAIRKDLLWVLDSLLSTDNYGGSAPPLTPDEKRAYANAVNQYRYDRWYNLPDEVKETKVPDGSMAVWKVNNMGVIAKTKSHTFAFDLFMPGVGPSDVNRPQDMGEKYADILDALFISHVHGDHIEGGIMQHMSKQNKPVYVSWDSPNGKNANKLWGTGGKYIKYKNMEILSIAGSQGPLNNSITVVRSDGITIAHEGDNTLVPAYDKLGDAGKIDIVVGQVHFYYEKFTRKARELANNSPRELFFFSGHEEELGHKVTIRMPFFAFSNPTMADMPCFVTTYGEGVFYPSGDPVRPSDKAKAMKKRSSIKRPSTSSSSKKSAAEKKADKKNDKKDSSSKRSLLR